MQCRGCETACPSAVPFGRLMEGTREVLAAERRMTPWWQRPGSACSDITACCSPVRPVLAVAQRLRLVPKRAGLARLPIRRGRALRASGTDVWMFTGCVMDAWLRDTHRSTQRVIEATGATVALPGAGGGCCGALHIHAGLETAARRLAEG